MSVDHKERAHAKLSASGANKWVACSLSPQMEEGYEETETGYSKEGTIAHEFVEIEQRKALNMIEPKEYDKKLAQIKRSEYFKDSMYHHVNTYVEYVLDIYNSAVNKGLRAEVFIEHRLDLGAYIPEGFGTSDNFVVAGDTLHIIDFKFGFNYVSAYDNTQLKIYAIGAMEFLDWDFDISNVVLHIVQPRIGNISTYELTVNRLAIWAEDDLKKYAGIAFDPNKGVLKAGSHCLYCKASHSCKTLKEEALKGVERFATKRPFKFEKMNDEEKAEVYTSLPLFKIWADNFKKHMESRASSGVKFEGLKVVEGASKRIVKNKSKLVEELESQGIPEELLYTKKLISIGEIERLAGKEFVESHVVKPKGKRVLTTKDDHRKEYEADIGFDDTYSDEKD